MGEFDLSINTNGEIGIYLELCDNWKEMISNVKPMDNKEYMKGLESYSQRMAKFLGLDRATLSWDDEWGLRVIDVDPGDACGLLLEKDIDGPHYYPHNVDTSKQALTLLATVLKYVHNVRAANIKSKNEWPLNWDIWPIEIIGKDSINPELSIKINLHPKLEEIVKRMNKTEEFKRFIESSAPFSNKKYSSLEKLDFSWSDERGIHSISMIPQGVNRPGLYLTYDAIGTFCYYDHNVKDPMHALALIGAVSNYIKFLKMKERELK